MLTGQHLFALIDSETRHKGRRSTMWKTLFDVGVDSSGRYASRREPIASINASVKMPSFLEVTAANFLV